MWESSHPHPDQSFNRLPALPDSYLSLPASNAVVDAPERPQAADYWRLFRKYILLVLLLTVVGGAAGFFSVALFSPVYQAQALLEVTSASPVIFKNIVGSADDASGVNIQTQIQLLRTSSFLRRVMERLQLETVPPPPVQNDVFSRLRRRLKTSTQDPLALMKEGLDMAVKTFSARPVTGTRIIEIECDSTSPDIAANFVNTLASEFIEQNAQGHAQSSQQASQWLSGQLEETRNKMQEAQQKLQEFVQGSGNLFVLQDHTLDNSKLEELQG